jgi:hypothetical protein
LSRFIDFNPAQFSNDVDDVFFRSHFSFSLYMICPRG